MTSIGAYGLQVTGIDGCGPLLGEVPAGFPRLHVTHRARPRDFQTTTIDDERATLVLDGGNGLLVDRATACATYLGQTMPPTADVVHPLLTAAAAAIGLWSGYELLHAAAFVAGDRVWAVLGDRLSGKSTFVARLAQLGYPIVCDDMLAFRGRTAFPGPRCLDLRADAAQRLSAGELVTGSGGRSRWRMTLAPVDAELTLGGLLFLAWGDVVEAVPIRPRELIGRVAACRTWRSRPADPVGLLELAVLPAWDLRRPRGWAASDEAATVALATVTGDAGPAGRAAGRYSRHMPDPAASVAKRG
jgi:hypothetical protein